MRIATNIAAFNAFRNVTRANSDGGRSLERLSSGYRNNRSADDAAGLVISQSLRAQVSGLRVATRNAQDARRKTQDARRKTQDARRKTQDAVSVMQTAEGALSEVHAMLIRIRGLALETSNTGSQDTPAITAAQNEFFQVKLALNAITQKAAFNSQTLLDGAFVKEFQVGANAGDKITVSVAFSINAGAIGVWNISITNGDAASDAIIAIDAATTTVSTTRAMFGAYQNRFESAINNLQVSSENLSASESRIRDSDIASEMVTFTREQILQHAATAMLSQANQVPRAVMLFITAPLDGTVFQTPARLRPTTQPG